MTTRYRRVLGFTLLAIACVGLGLTLWPIANLIVLLILVLGIVCLAAKLL